MDHIKKLILLLPLIPMSALVWMVSENLKSTFMFICIAGGSLIFLIITSVIYEIVWKKQINKQMDEDSDWEQFRKNIL